MGAARHRLAWHDHPVIAHHAISDSRLHAHRGRGADRDEGANTVRTQQRFEARIDECAVAVFDYDRLPWLGRERVERLRAPRVGQADAGFERWLGAATEQGRRRSIQLPIFGVYMNHHDTCFARRRDQSLLNRHDIPVERNIVAEACHQSLGMTKIVLHVDHEQRSACRIGVGARPPRLDRHMPASGCVSFGRRRSPCGRDRCGIDDPTHGHCHLAQGRVVQILRVGSAGVLGNHDVIVSKKRITRARLDAATGDDPRHYNGVDSVRAQVQVDRGVPECAESMFGQHDLTGALNRTNWIEPVGPPRSFWQAYRILAVLRQDLRERRALDNGIIGRTNPDYQHLRGTGCLDKCRDPCCHPRHHRQISAGAAVITVAMAEVVLHVDDDQCGM